MYDEERWRRIEEQEQRREDKRRADDLIFKEQLEQMYDRQEEKFRRQIERDNLRDFSYNPSDSSSYDDVDTSFWGNFKRILFFCAIWFFIYYWLF